MINGFQGNGIYMGPIPQAPGSSNDQINNDAPKTINSTEVIVFDASTSMVTLALPPEQKRNFLYISAFASVSDKGTLLLLCTEKPDNTRETKHKFIGKNLSSELAALAVDCDFARCNGRSHYVNGLPQNFGGSVDIKYESGEKIIFADNQSPIFGPETAQKISDFFENAFTYEEAISPDINELREVQYYQENLDDHYVRYYFTINPDKTAKLKREYKFSDPEPHLSEEDVTADVTEGLLNIIKDNDILLWEGLLEKEVIIQKTSLKFIFTDGKEINVSGSASVPLQYSSVMFNIQQYMAKSYK